MAMENAGITLLSGDLTGIVRARMPARATLRNSKQNLFFAFFHNPLCVPIAPGLPNPAITVQGFGLFGTCSGLP